MPTKARQLVLVPLDDLRPNPANPKGHADQLIDASLERLGYVEPIVEDARTGLLVSGHGRRERLIAARTEGRPAPEGVEVVRGEWRVYVVRGWASRDDAEALAALVALNNIGPAGGWHAPAYGSILDQLDTRPDLAGLLGPTPVDVADLLNPKPEPEPDLPAEERLMVPTVACSSLIAAHETDRVGRGCELSPLYADVAVARLQRDSGHVPTRKGKPVDVLAHVLAHNPPPVDPGT